MSSQNLDEIIKAKDAEISKLLEEIQALKAKIQDQTIISETLDNLEITIDNNEITETISFKPDEEKSNEPDMMNMLNMFMGSENNASNPIMEIMQQMMGGNGAANPIMEMMQQMMGGANPEKEEDAKPDDIII